MAGLGASFVKFALLLRTYIQHPDWFQRRPDADDDWLAPTNATSAPGAPQHDGPTPFNQLFIVLTLICGAEPCLVHRRDVVAGVFLVASGLMRYRQALRRAAGF